MWMHFAAGKAAEGRWEGRGGGHLPLLPHAAHNAHLSLAFMLCDFLRAGGATMR